MSSSDEEITKNNRNISTTQYSPQLRPHSTFNNGLCSYCNSNLIGGKLLKSSKSNLQISKSQHIQDTYFGSGQNYKFKKNDMSEFEKKMKKASKEIERLNRIIADQAIELEALTFVKQMSQYEVDIVVIQENQKLKKEIEELKEQINLVTHHESIVDNSETYNYWNDRKDSEKIQMDFSNIVDLDENGDINNDNFNLEYGLNRIDEIKKLLLEEYKFFKHLQSEPSLNQHIDEYTKKRNEILATFTKLQHSLFPLFSPINEKKILNISRKQSVFCDDVTPSNKSTLEIKLQPN
ncbi:hypothetical protein ABPG74_018129 [Tetrahymena malaccensis]